MGKNGLLAGAGWASIGAGAIHATAAGLHNDHRQTLSVFVGLALFQIGWGALALSPPTRAIRLVGVVGAFGNAAAVGGWLVAKTSGISIIDGLEQAEGVQAADAIAAGLAGVAALVALAASLSSSLPSLPMLPFAAAVATVALAVPGMVSAGEHSHEGEEHAHGEGHDAVGTPYDPTKPIDLSGTPGVTPEQQARAENLVALTLARLPQWADTAVAEAAGYRSIGDSVTGDEHFVNWSLVDDETVLDPDHPESLVYRVGDDGSRTLEAAMFMLPRSATLETVPDVGGALTQWHAHNDLCFTPPPDAHVIGVIGEDTDCRPPNTKLGAVPMLHVWITPNECGPFASLEGVGAGQVQEGEQRLCDHAHGSG